MNSSSEQMGAFEEWCSKANHSSSTHASGDHYFITVETDSDAARIQHEQIVDGANTTRRRGRGRAPDAHAGESTPSVSLTLFGLMISSTVVLYSVQYE